MNADQLLTELLDLRSRGIDLTDYNVSMVSYDPLGHTQTRFERHIYGNLLEVRPIHTNKEICLYGNRK